MNVQKIIAAAAVLVGFAGTAGIALYSNAVVGNAGYPVDASTSIASPAVLDSLPQPFAGATGGVPGPASNRSIQTLPTIVVRPSPELLRQLQAERGSAASSLRMPWYSFNSDTAVQ